MLSDSYGQQIVARHESSCQSVETLEGGSCMRIRQLSMHLAHERCGFSSRY